MKHFCKYFLPLFAAFGLLIGSGCSNIMEPLGIPDEEGGLSITVLTSSGKSEARTLYPNATFTKFVLSFAGPEQHADVELTGETNQTTITDLASGEWTITATGYVTINGKEYPAASGKKTISCDSGTSQELAIPISAKQDGTEGFFSYSVQYPQAKVNNAYLTIIDITTREPLNNIDLRETASGSISLQPGYYLMTIQLSNEYQTAGHSEILHIYSSMETKADYTYEDADFVDLITLSGTATITINGSTLPETMYRGISARDGNNNNYNAILTGTTWSMKLPAFDIETAIYFEVYVQSDTYGQMSKDIAEPIMVKDQDNTSINFGTINFNRIVISGTANITLNGQKPNMAYVGLYSDANYRETVGSGNVNLDNGTWSIGIESFTTEKVLYIGVAVDPGNGGYQYRRAIEKTVTVSNQDKSGITLGDIEFGTITLSGTAKYTINDKAPDSVRIHVFSDPSYDYSSSLLGSASIDTATGTWSLSLEALDIETPVYFRVEVQSNTYGFMSKDITNPTMVKDQNVTDIVFDPVNFKRIVISGTVNVTINGEKPNQAYVVLSDYSNQMTNVYVNLDNGTWSIIREPFTTENTLYIAVEALSDNGSYYRKTEISVRVSNQDQSGVELGDIDFGTITLRGTANVTVNGNVPDSVQISAYSDSSYDYSSSLGSTSINTADGIWSLSIEVLDTETPVYFKVEAQSDTYGYLSKDITNPTMVKDQNVTDIDLGTVNFDRVAIGGTANVTVNGQRPNQANVYLYSDDTYSNQVANGYVNLDNGTWSIGMEPSDAETILYIEVMAYHGIDWSLYRRKTGIAVTVLDQDKTGIELGNIEFGTITLSGTANVTINDKVPDRALVYAYSDSNYMNQLGNTSIDTASGNWSLSIESLGTDTPIYFNVEVQSDTYGYMSENITTTTTVKDQNITDINLGTVEFNRIAISGTVNVTVNGQRPDNASLGLYSDETYSNQVANGTINLDNGTWSIIMEPQDSETTLYIVVHGSYPNNGSWYGYQKETGTMDVFNQDITGIPLGDIDIITE